MKEIKIQFDYLNGPLWKDKVNQFGELITGIPCIDNDKAVQTLNDEAERMYDSLYSFDSSNSCVFNNEKFYQIKSQLLSLVQTLIVRLNTLNDGTFKIAPAGAIFSCKKEYLRLNATVMIFVALSLR